MATLVEAKVGGREDTDNTIDNMMMGRMGTSGLFVPTKEEQRPRHLYSTTTSFTTNAEAKGKVNYV